MTRAAPLETAKLRRVRREIVRALDLHVDRFVLIHGTVPDIESGHTTDRDGKVRFTITLKPKAPLTITLKPKEPA